MAEENSTLDDRVKSEMAKIAGCFSILKNFDDAEKSSQQASLIENAKSIHLSEYPISEDATDEQKAEFAEAKNRLNQEYDCPLHVAYSKIDASLQDRIRGMQEDYEKNKVLVYDEIEKELNEAMKDAKNKGEAVDKLLLYFIPLLDKPEVTQEEADAIELSNFAQRAKMPMTTKQHTGIGDIEYARISRYRQLLADYIKEGKDEEDKEKTVYLIDKDKLKELTDSPLTGSALYTVAQQKEAA